MVLAIKINLIIDKESGATKVEDVKALYAMIKEVVEL